MEMEKRMGQVERAIRMMRTARNHEDELDQRLGSAIRLLIRRGATRVALKLDKGTWGGFANTDDDEDAVYATGYACAVDATEAAARMWPR